MQFEGRRPAPDQRIANAQFAINNGTDFGQEAKTISESSDASTGGDMGWVSPYQYTTTRESAIFNTPIGDVTPMVNDNGYHVYKIISQETRTADAAQQAKLKPALFSNWLAELQSNSLVWEDSAALTSLTPGATRGYPGRTIATVAVGAGVVASGRGRRRGRRTAAAGPARADQARNGGRVAASLPRRPRGGPHRNGRDHDRRRARRGGADVPPLPGAARF